MNNQALKGMHLEVYKVNSQALGMDWALCGAVPGVRRDALGQLGHTEQSGETRETLLGLCLWQRPAIQDILPGLYPVPSI